MRWLRQRCNQTDNRTQRPRLMQLVKQGWPKRERLPRDQVFWAGQRVDAQWVTGSGQRGNIAFKQRWDVKAHHKRPKGSYGHEAQIISYDDSRECYRVFYLRDQSENENVPAQYIRIQQVSE
jgi:hypothetical protein